MRIARTALVEARLKRHWSQEEAAEAIGIDHNTLYRWEAGKATPRGYNLRQLCDVYGMTATELGFEQDKLAYRDSKQVAESGLIEETRNRVSGLSTQQDTNKQKPTERIEDSVKQHEFVREDLLSLLSQSIAQGIIEAVRELESQIMDVSRRNVLLEALGAIATVIVSSKVEPFNIPEHRLTFEPWERLFAAISRPSTVNTDTFNHFLRLIETGWGLCNAGETETARQVLESFLPEMVRLVPQQPEAALIAAQGLRLQSILYAHQLKLPEMVPLCQQAVFFARQANDPDALSASLNGLAVAYKYGAHLDASFSTYQEGLAYCAQASPLLRSRVYAGSASMFAQRERKQEALFYMGLAYEHFPDQPETDPHFLSADNGIYMLAYYQGLMYLAMKQPTEADKAFESYKYHPLGRTTPERNRLEIINHQGRAAIMANDLDKYVACLKEGLEGAVALRSKKRFDEALTIYQHDLPAKWQRESAITQVVELFQLPTGEK